jgi:hypothetical protein
MDDPGQNGPVERGPSSRADLFVKAASSRSHPAPALVDGFPSDATKRARVGTR